MSQVFNPETGQLIDVGSNEYNSLVIRGIILPIPKISLIDKFPSSIRAQTASIAGISESSDAPVRWFSHQTQIPCSVLQNEYMYDDFTLRQSIIGLCHKELIVGDLNLIPMDVVIGINDTHDWIGFNITEKNELCVYNTTLDETLFDMNDMIDIILNTINNPNINMMMHIEISYLIPPGPFDYTELRYQTSTAIKYIMWSDGDPDEWTETPDDDQNEYISQSGVYDSHKPIPEDIPNSKNSQKATLWIIYDNVPYIMSTVIGG